MSNPGNTPAAVVARVYLNNGLDGMFRSFVRMGFGGRPTAASWASQPQRPIEDTIAETAWLMLGRYR